MVHCNKMLPLETVISSRLLLTLLQKLIHASNTSAKHKSIK